VAELNPSTMQRRIVPEPLDPAAFRPFGQVLDRTDARPTRSINDGTAWRLHDLAQIDADLVGAHSALSLVRATPRVLPFRLQCLERHRLGTQAFVPLDAARWIVIVAEGDSEPDLRTLRAFLATGKQGVNYARGTWHHPLVVIEREASFLAVDRVADNGTEDCEVRDVVTHEVWVIAR
jgi:ureidoglycolate lyase